MRHAFPLEKSSVREYPPVNGDPNMAVDRGFGDKRPGYLFVLPWSFSVLTGGVNQVVFNLAREMQRTGCYDPIVLCGDWNATEPIWDEVHGIRTVRWRIQPFDPDASWKARGAYWFWEKRFRERFAQFCAELRICAVNLHYVGPLAFTLDRFRRRCSPTLPLLLSFHGKDITDLQDASSKTIRRWRECLLRASAAVVCSKDLGDRLVLAVDGAVAPAIVYNGIDMEYFTSLRRGAPRPMQGRYILSVGRFQWKKGQDVLIGAFAEISEEYPDIDLVLVGASDVALPSLRDLCVRKGVERRVHFFPDRPHEEIPDFLRNAVLFALPSREEPFGIVLAEAGALGVPIVASAVGGVPELVVHGRTGFLVPPDAPADLAHALRTILNDPVASRKMGERMRDRVAVEFTWQDALTKYRAITEAARVTAMFDAGSDGAAEDI